MRFLRRCIFHNSASVKVFLQGDVTPLTNVSSTAVVRINISAKLKCDSNVFEYFFMIVLFLLFYVFPVWFFSHIIIQRRAKPYNSKFQALIN